MSCSTIHISEEVLEFIIYALFIKLSTNPTIYFSVSIVLYFKIKDVKNALWFKFNVLHGNF